MKISTDPTEWILTGSHHQSCRPESCREKKIHLLGRKNAFFSSNVSRLLRSNSSVSGYLPTFVKESLFNERPSRPFMEKDAQVIKAFRVR